MAEPLRLTVRTPSESLLEVDHVEWVHIELADDKALTIWPGHLPMLGETKPAALHYADQKGAHSFECPPGIVHVSGHTVAIYVAAAVGEQTLQEHEQSRLYTRLSETLIAFLAQAGAT